MEQGGWETIAPGAMAFDEPGGPVWHAPRAMADADFAGVIAAFGDAAARAGA
ncbi:MAG: hypothetical protein ACREEE_02190 [Dongiaceae bacterium]